MSPFITQNLYLYSSNLSTISFSSNILSIVSSVPNEFENGTFSVKYHSIFSISHPFHSFFLLCYSFLLLFPHNMFYHLQLLLLYQLILFRTLFLSDTWKIF